MFALLALGVHSAAMRDDQTPIYLSMTPGRRAAGAPACVIVIYGGELGQRVELPEGSITVGRDEDNAIAVPLETISRRHARIFRRDEIYYVEDLGSTNGTYVNEVEVGQPAALRNGDLLRCGGAVLKFIEGGNVEALYHEEIYRLAITDGLTQISNKRHFWDFLEREIARATRHARPLSLVLFDVDRFKEVNDTWGHLAGDRVLAGLATLAAGQVRRDELLARYGGEEFAVVLPETDLSEATAFCERIRRAVEGESYEYDGQPLQVTISLGAAALREGDTLDALVARADENLYRAKREGRNRTVAG